MFVQLDTAQRYPLDIDVETPMKLACYPSKCSWLSSSAEHSIHYKKQRPYFVLQFVYLPKYYNKTKMVIYVTNFLLFSNSSDIHYINGVLIQEF
ncbi:hypothetical protein ES288_A11G350100v1 [Gossypium darwinii]|uniref:Uncharacterized protein n=1 Tax=Gossypium darwinii TaxID=34276 RepID=A0A5D2ESL4_GOSDA|nr:hypothetical protein ES288_A11G350100v1 [Gossypium darwinii]